MEIKKAYTVHYTLNGEKMIGGARGNNEAEALEEFAVFHGGENYKIEKIEFYK